MPKAIKLKSFHTRAWAQARRLRRFLKAANRLAGRAGLAAVSLRLKRSKVSHASRKNTAAPIRFVMT